MNPSTDVPARIMKIDDSNRGTLSIMSPQVMQQKIYEKRIRQSMMNAMTHEDIENFRTHAI